MTVQRRRDWPAAFRPNCSPPMMIRAGIFGGTYFSRPELIKVEEFPPTWFQGLAHRRYASDESNPEVNKYGVLAGRSQTFWEKQDWMHPDDPRGWVQWWCRYYRGRRHEDDGRQIQRWIDFASVDSGRWTRNLLGKIRDAEARVNDETISPVIRQSLLQWAFIPTQDDYRRFLDS